MIEPAFMLQGKDACPRAGFSVVQIEYRSCEVMGAGVVATGVVDVVV